jgi:hypothetical protein
MVFLAGIGLWLGFTNDTAWSLGSVELSPKEATAFFLCLGGVFAVFGVLIMIIGLRQIGLPPYIDLDDDALTLPVARRGNVRIPFSEIAAWQVIDVGGGKAVEIEVAGQSFRLEARLMESYREFGDIVSIIRTKAFEKESSIGG